MNIKDNLTDSTERIYNDLKSKYYIELECNPALLGCNSQNWGMIQSHKIITPNEIPNKAAFAHELLHIQQFELGLVDCETVRKVISNYFSDEFLLKVNNNLAHFRMLPIFIKLGFEKQTFLQCDLSKELNMSKERILNFSKELSNNILICEKFICEYSIVKFFEFFEELNTKECIEILRKFDEKLFNILDLTFSEWIESTNSDNIKFFDNLKNRLIQIDN